MSTTLRRLIFVPTVLVALFLMSAPASSQEVITTLNDGILCRMTTFEDLGHYQPINPELEGLIPRSGMHFDVPGWQTLTSGNYANNPSPVTVAVIMFSDSREITFDKPVSMVSLYYSSRSDVTLDAFDAAGNLVATSTGAANVQSTYPPFSLWELLEVNVSEDIITRVTVTGSAGGTGIDDVCNCRFTTPTEIISDLIQDVIDLDLRKGISVSMDAKLEAALRALEDLNANNDVAAINALEVFINAVEIHRGVHLTDFEANYFVTLVSQIIEWILSG